jgi:hypothetical protein
MKQLLVGISSVLLLVGCASGGKPAPSSSATSAATPTPSYTADYGLDAAIIAGHVPGCTGVTAGDIGGGAASGMVATASCTMLGHKVILETWKNPVSEPGEDLMFASGGDATAYADGLGWTQLPGENGMAADAQLRIAQAFAAALGGTVHTAR